MRFVPTCLSVFLLFCIPFSFSFFGQKSPVPFRYICSSVYSQRDIRLRLRLWTESDDDGQASGLYFTHHSVYLEPILFGLVFGVFGLRWYLFSVDLMDIIVLNRRLENKQASCAICKKSG